MARLVPVLVRVDRDAKAAAEEILSSCDLTLADAVDLLLRQIVAEGALPFSPTTRDQMSVQAMQHMLTEDAEDGTAMADEFVLVGRNQEPRFWTDSPAAVTHKGPSSPGSSKARRELASMMRSLRPSVDSAPWWPETMD